jgi:hypothetical protein
MSRPFYRLQQVLSPVLLNLHARADISSLLLVYGGLSVAAALGEASAKSSETQGDSMVHVCI